MNNWIIYTVLLLSLALCRGTSPVQAAEPNASTPVVNPPATWTKPAWLTDLSVGFKESYDSSVFLSSVNPGYYAGGYTIPPGSVKAGENAWSMVSTVSPRVGVNFLPWLGGQPWLQTASLAYAPEVTRYSEQPSENYEAHRVVAALKTQGDDWSFKGDNAFTYIDGNKFSPTYPGGYVTAWNTVAPRERRDQYQDRAAVSLQYNWHPWFFRPTASLLYYDLRTARINRTGYQNYINRYDVNGGADGGYQITPGLAGTLGYRYGYQYQQQLSWSPYDSTGTYQRVLAGLEGKPWSWLEGKIQGGPEFHQYESDTATHISPVNDLNLLTHYGEASLTATFDSQDLLTFKYKQWQWVSSVGKVPYFESCYDLNYHRKLTRRLGLDAGGRLLDADYNSGNLTTCQRNDLQYTFTAGLGFAVTPRFSLSLAYQLDLGRNAQDNIANPNTRDYERNLVTAGAQYKF